MGVERMTNAAVAVGKEAEKFFLFSFSTLVVVVVIIIIVYLSLFGIVILEDWKKGRIRNEMGC